MKRTILNTLGLSALFASMLLTTSNANAQRVTTKTTTPKKTTVTPSRTPAPKPAPKPAKTYSAPKKTYTAPTKTYSAPKKTYSTPKKTYSTPTKTSTTAKKTYSTGTSTSAPKKTYSTGTSTSTPKKTYSTGTSKSTPIRSTSNTAKSTYTPKKTYVVSKKPITPLTTKDSRPVMKTVTLDPVQNKAIYTPERTPGIQQIQEYTAKKDGNVNSKNATAAVITMATGTDNVPLMVDDSGNPMTVYEAVATMPAPDRDSVSLVCQREIQQAQQENRPQDVIFWNRVNRTITSPNENACLGKSYGDPHMRTYDGYTYDLQSVGEYVLTKSSFSTFEIQTRQSSASGRISLNTAAAMNVNGDRVSIYTQDFPDAYTETPVRVNGSPLTLARGETFSLLMGGIIRRETDNSYRISWPTGEQALIKFFSRNRYMNVLPQVFAAGNHGGYVGLLGNADGISGNDLTSKFGTQTTIVRNFYSFNSVSNNQAISSNARKQEVRYNKTIIEDFAASWRVNSVNSLFNYNNGKSTYSYRKNTKAKKVATLATEPQVNIDNAKKACEDAGITDEDAMKGCILDVSISNDLELAKAIADIENDDALVKEMKVTNTLQKSKD